MDRGASDCFQKINALEQELDVLWCGKVAGILLQEKRVFLLFEGGAFGQSQR